MRGVIENVKRKQQINDFSGLLYGNITPTDTDGLIEYKDMAWILIEVKYLSTDLPFGQRLAFERFVKDVSSKKQAIAIIAEHNVSNTEESIDVASCYVRECYWSGRRQWKRLQEKLTVKYIIDSFLSRLQGEGAD
jgi:hypothetical protein